MWTRPVHYMCYSNCSCPLVLCSVCGDLLPLHHCCSWLSWHLLHHLSDRASMRKGEQRDLCDAPGGWDCLLLPDNKQAKSHQWTTSKILFYFILVCVFFFFKHLIPCFLLERSCGLLFVLRRCVQSVSTGLAEMANRAKWLTQNILDNRHSAQSTFANHRVKTQQLYSWSVGLCCLSCRIF